MTSDDAARWRAAAGNSDLQAALAKGELGTLTIGSSLRAVADDSDADEDVRYLAGLLTTIAWFMPNGHDWNNPYGPFATFADRRSAIPADLSAVDILALAQIVELIPNLILRSRTFDVLALIGDRTSLPTWRKAQLQALADHGITSEAMEHDVEQWERGLAVARRFRGVAAEPIDEIERQLVEAATTSLDNDLAVGAARLLHEYQFGLDYAVAIAEHLVAHAERIGSLVAQTTLETAAKWFSKAGDHARAQDTTYSIVQHLRAAADSSEGIRAGVHLELALKILRTLPRSARERVGAADLATELARQIREIGAATLGEMKAHSVESGDIGTAVAAVLSSIRSEDRVESLERFVSVQRFASLSSIRTDAEEGARRSPLSLLFERRTFSPDGRTVYRSPQDDRVKIYNVRASTWEGMIEQYQWRVSLLGGVILPRAWLQMSTDHRIHIGDFRDLVSWSAIIPSSHEGVFARGLHYGYSGDFGTAVHLLVPAVEALVRLHLGNAGERTSTIDGEGNENEIGLSALMENERVVEIFGDDITFELRALLCGPIGPNLRNEVAHGLTGDSVFSSPTSVYLWWFVLKLVLASFANPIHDPQAAEAREPAVPEQDEA